MPFLFSLLQRSLLLACVSGLVAAILSCAIVSESIISTWTPTKDDDPQVVNLIGPPVLVILFQGLYVVRAARLLVMYDPVKRRHWGRFLNERVVLRAAVCLTVVFEGAVLLAMAVYGIKT